MKKQFHPERIVVTLIMASLAVQLNAQIIISGFMANPAGNDAPYEYVQLIASENINFATTNYSVVWANNGVALSSGWVAGTTITYGFDLTSGSVAMGEVFYVGGSGKLINGTGSTDISSAKWIRSIDYLNTTGDGFGTNGTNVMGNQGQSADGIAVFAGTTSTLTASSIPVDAVFYGGQVGTARPATDGYTLPDNDRYSNAQGTYGNGTNTFRFPPINTDGQYMKFTGTYNPYTHNWSIPRTGTSLMLNTGSGLTDIVTGITFSGLYPVINISAPPASNTYIFQGDNNMVLQRFDLDVMDRDAILDTLIVATTGTFVSNDIKTNGFKLWLSTDATLDANDSLLSTKPSSGPGMLQFNLPGIVLDSATKTYLFVTADISSSATDGATISVYYTPFRNIIFRNGTKTGTDPVTPGGTKTIVTAGTAILNASSLIPFGNIPVGSTSPEQVFTISGINLSPASGNVIIVPPTGFQISLTSGSGYTGSNLPKSYTGGSLSPTNIYVVFKPTTYSTYNSNITIGGGGASSVNIPVSGTGVSADVTPPAVDTAYATSTTTVLVIFTEAVDTSAINKANYQFYGGITISTIVRSPQFTSVTLNLATAMTPLNTYYLRVANISDTSANHNKMGNSPWLPIRYGNIKINTYNIAQVTNVNSQGQPDSNNVYCRLYGVVQQGINFNNNPNAKYFFIHDGTGGIGVFRQGNPTYNIREGDRLKVVGRIGLLNGVTRIQIDSFQIVDSFQKTRTPAEVSKLTENTEAEIITLRKLKLVNTTLWPVIPGNTRSVTATNGKDTFTITIVSGCNLQGTPAPSGLFDISGIGAQNDNTLPYTSGYNIYPRSLKDLYIYPPYPVYTISQVHPENITTGEADSIGVYCKLSGTVYGINYYPNGLYFTLMDPTGGIVVYKGKNLDPPYIPKEGDLVDVIGMVQQYNGLTEIIPDSVILRDSNQSIGSPVLATQLSEINESRLVELRHLTIVPPSQWPSTPGATVDVEVTDGTNHFIIRIFANCSIQGTFVPPPNFNIAGIVGQDDRTLPFVNDYFIAPRSVNDYVLFNSLKEKPIQHDLTFYPNPSEGVFNVANPSGLKLNFDIYNCFGQLVQSGIIDGSVQSISLDETNPGLYILKLRDTSNHSSSFKLEIR
jgi:DNA/RNA endonuclease YhcR with UshA esterase domain